MSYEAVTQGIDIWITQYVAGFCLLTIAMRALVLYTWGRKWQQPIRDLMTYLAAIGVLTLVLAFRPANQDALLWLPITWFAFAMLMMLELFWLLYLIEIITRHFRGPEFQRQRRMPALLMPGPRQQKHQASALQWPMRTRHSR